jgi:hypothetical protein
MCYKGRLRCMPEGQNESQSSHQVNAASENMAFLTPRICSAAALVLFAARARIEASNALIRQIQMQIRSLHSNESTQP